MYDRLKKIREVRRMSILLIVSLIACCAMIISSVTLAVGMKKMRRLGDMEAGCAADGPLVSVVVPACNEEKNIEKSLMSLLSQEYANLEILVVNDRSTDNTAAVLKRLKSRFPRLTILEIVDLPGGWMGKSHALANGAALARGEYLLFTDADVVLEKTTISRAVAYMQGNRLDHLTLGFKNVTRGWLLNSLILDAGMGLLFLFRPWTVKKSTSRSFMGIGAFNMLRRAVYQKIGGHEEIKMHPIDDLMLGKLIKQHGFCQDCLLADNFVVVPWYDSVRAMGNGLEKNVFALVHYRVLLIPVALAAIIIPSIWPLWGLVLGDMTVRTVCLLTLAIRLATFHKGLLLQGLPEGYLPGALITPYISCYIILKSVFAAMNNDGILWRGRHYPLAELRKTEPLLF
jgi:glycosyltransferase involved in cell wall biosynthesis